MFEIGILVVVLSCRNKNSQDKKGVNSVEEGNLGGRLGAYDSEKSN